ncbi:ATP synthase subunit C [Thermospira aquatica]|uniref:ATP synthase F(0) sector subunit c n=1 Tax=Thermospira aquatica TaxID=2828656 RepID=A0AAX3BD62_9SPIR|nr:ATP synthase subunit C [Thermospira aquatica]URA10125.1 hypothetical protein KDW03_11685 [Thermospira aquatica]
MAFLGMMIILVGMLLVAGVVSSRYVWESKVSRVLLQVVSRVLMVVNALIVVGFLTTQTLYAQEKSVGEADTHIIAVEKTTPGYGMGLLAAAIAVAVGALGGGIAVGMAASAGMGALSENPKLFGNILIFVGLAEGIAIYGLVVALFILQKL